MRMTEEQFDAAVQEAIREHPEWAQGIGEAVRRGLTQRVSEERAFGVAMEVVARTLVDARPLSEMRKQDQDLLREKLAACRAKLAFRWDSVLVQLEEP